jgi:voltage-gated potassium channel
MAPEESQPEEIGPFQFTVLVLSIVVLITLVIDTTLDLPVEVSGLLQTIDNTVCIVLLIDFLIRFRKAPSKLQFMKWGWIDLVASSPNVELLRLGRLVRVFRVLRMLRGIRLIHRLATALFKDKIKGGFAAAGLSVFLLLCFSSISILICEQNEPEANIATAGDAMWWSVATITTVGYGDRYPITTEGRCVAVVLMLSGLGLFGTISALTAALFIGLPEDDDGINQLTDEVRQLRAEIAGLRGHPLTPQGAAELPDS